MNCSEYNTDSQTSVEFKLENDLSKLKYYKTAMYDYKEYKWNIYIKLMNLYILSEPLLCLICER